MIRLAAAFLVACSSAPIPPVCSGTIYGAAIAPSDPCLPPLQVWVRQHALFDGQSCAYMMWPLDTPECPMVGELLAYCPLPDGYSAAMYDVAIDYAAGGYLWKGAVRVPSGAVICEQDGGGMLTVVP